jgi:hypothetical protein
MQNQNQKRNRNLTLFITWCLPALATIILATAGCTQTFGKEKMHTFNEPTTTYGAGRFVIDMPACLKFSGTYSMRIQQITEVLWPVENLQQAASIAWQNRIDEIKKRPAPENQKSALIETRDIPLDNIWCKAVFYYGDAMDEERGDLEILRHRGFMGVWIKAFGEITGKEFMHQKSTDLARAYRAPTTPNSRVPVLDGKDSFYLQYGAIDLPFEYKESVNIVFKSHPLDGKMALSVRTDVVDEVEEEGLMDRLAGFVLTKLGADLKIEKIRTGKRTVAGLKGEEVLIRASEPDGAKKLAFTWDYPGQKSSPHAPNIIIDLFSEDGHLEEKLALWDAVLDSMRPAGR